MTMQTATANDPTTTEQPAAERHRTSFQFWKLPSAVAARRDLTPAAKIVVAYLIDRQGGNDDAWPGIRRIARACGIAAKTAMRAVARLESAGLIDVQRGADGPKRALNHYRARVDRMTTPPKCPRRRSQNVHAGAPKMSTQAWSKCPQIQTHSRLQPDLRALRLGGLFVKTNRTLAQTTW
jgi:hypothetical protein